MFFYLLSLPRGFLQAGDFALVGEFAKANAAEAEATEHAVGAAASLAAGIGANLIFRSPFGLCDQTFLSHCSRSLFAEGHSDLL
jgi:hypothetical protein